MDQRSAIDETLVKRLLAAQFPQWAHLPLRKLASTGTDNAIYRLGDEMAVRLPRVEWAAGQAETEYAWLPKLAPHLPLAISQPLALGTPAEGYPWHWSVHRWLEGENATTGRIDDLRQAAIDLAGFVAALQRIDAAGGPPPGFGRGMPLATRDAYVRDAIAQLHGTIDTEAAALAWDVSLKAPVWQGQPVWIHADIHAGNLLVDRGRISAVIDFGGVGVGDPAGDLLVAWSVLTADTRPVFREALRPDDATWARGRGWALSVGLIALPYYRDTNPVVAAISRHMVDEVLIDFKNGL
ncbi:aminoglycoside phosphotransferase family protein [Paenibacillus arenilitoris]|uniref:Aminoglycoside phosphotransferase family protein n=1 Tax=Paenibacillus arenilitoris TaxID=2772299 RepID=A0A927CN76_9BACL|nr:aminoglycoside phosphotransferase family protein [Paenibacillus arenilitoris]MBD2868690.1 aminoglycoside phosphotransferase family protein [Paenibacillus arenilitoris]